jgi:formylglycine-generating enzyme required for sulfatase activity
MKRLVAPSLLLVAMALLGQCADKPTAPTFLQTTISGKVVDATTGKPVPSATVSSEPATEQILTNAEGGYVLRASVEVGRSYRVTATAAGYAQNSIEAVARVGENRIADLRLAPSVPSLTVFPDSLFFETTSQSKALVIHNAGTGVLSWSITVPSEPWLRVSPASGRTLGQDGTAIVTVDRSLIASNGVYALELVVASDGGTKTVPVAVLVEGKTPSARITVSPVSLAFGIASNRATIGVSNSGTGELIWRASSAQDWIKVSPDSGAVSGGSVQVFVEVDRARLQPGEHVGAVDVVSSGGSVAVPVTVSVPTPVLALSTRDLDFGFSANALSLSITNPGTGDLKWAFDPKATWLRVEPQQGVTGQTTTAVAFTVQRQGLEAGAYETQVRLTTNSTSEPMVDLRVRMRVLAKPTLTVSPDSLAFGPRVETMRVAVVNANNDTLSWQVTTTEPWLSVDRASGQVTTLGGTSVNLAVLRTGLAAGPYHAQLVVSSNGGQKSLPVTMEVPQAPRLSVATRSIDLGSTGVFGTIDMLNLGTGKLTWTVQDTARWLEVTPANGTTLDEKDQVSLSVNRTGLVAGAYAAIVSIESDGGEYQVRVQMTVAPVPVLAVSVDTLDFGMQVDADTLVLTNQGNAPLLWQVETTAPWVSVTPLNGATQPGQTAVIRIEVARGNLAIGSRSAALTVASNGGTHGVQVGMTVPGASLRVAPDSLVYAPDTGTELVTLSNEGNVPLTWTIETEARWLRASPANGTIPAGGSQGVIVSVDQASLATGEYTGALRITSNSTAPAHGVQVRVRIEQNAAPIADAGADKTVRAGARGQLDGSRSRDPDGDRLSYRWSAPLGVTLSSATTAAPTFTAAAEGVYPFVLVVSDGQRSSEPDTVVFTVTAADAPRPTLTADLPGGATMEFVWIEPGTFTMGSPSSEPGRDEREGPQHLVTIARGFWLGKYEVTQEQWAAVTGRTPWAGQEYVGADQRCPANYVSWYDAQGFIALANSASGDSLYRLPSEAEWEYACRAGTTTPWSFGADESVIGSYAWYVDNTWSDGLRYAQPVGLKLPNPAGLYDIHGNAGEWCQDWYGPYSQWDQVDPVGPEKGTERIFRDEPWAGGAASMRSARRDKYYPDRRESSVGFRLVRLAQAVPRNHRPTSNAGPDQTVVAGALAQLDGAGSRDEDGDELTYQWTGLSGTKLTNPSAVRPSFTTVAPGAYGFALVVSDGKADSTPDTVVVTVVEARAPGETLVTNLPGGATMDFVSIDPGTFTMGSPASEPGRSTDEGPQHDVTLSEGFWLARTETTQQQWQAAMGTEPWAGQMGSFRVGPQFPAVFVSWNDAQAFVHALNQAIGDSLFRLPTEAEWEYSCRAGTAAAWSFGDEVARLADNAWVAANTTGAGEQFAHAVGTKPPNPWGLYDMHGNVREWCADRYAPYEPGAQQDPVGPEGGTDRVARGGYFSQLPERTRSAARSHASPTYQAGDALGFRVVRLARAVPLRVNSSPRAEAGPDQQVVVGSMVTLDGASSTDSDGDPLTYLWGVPAGVSLDDPRAPRPTFRAVVPGVYRLTLVVDDGHQTSEPDTVVVVVQQVATPDQLLTAALPGGANMDFIWLPAGTFTMGDPELGETPHLVTLTKGFYMGRYEVTQSQWSAVMGSAPWTGLAYVQEHPENPAVNVSWDDVQGMVHALNQAAGDSSYRMPTEAEWEYACRAGTTTPWSFGEDEAVLGEYAWYSGNAWQVGEQYAHPVGTKRANPWGLYDMHGNVLEWVQDWLGQYPAGHQTDPTGLHAGSRRVFRGGCIQLGRHRGSLGNPERERTQLPQQRDWGTVGSVG